MYFISHLDFDWRLLHREPSLKWPARIYLANRLSSISCAVSMVVGLNITSRINCQAWIRAAFLFPLLELELSLLLIVIRVIAIWKCSSFIIGLTAVTLSIHSGIALHLLTGVQSFWDPGRAYMICVVDAPRLHLLLMSIATITTYAILLIAMLVGLLQIQRGQSSSFGVWKTLCNQGWVWFALAIVAEVPTLTLVLLNLNPSLNWLCQVPRVVIASLGTTTMFRTLYDYRQQRGAVLPIRVLKLTPSSNTASNSSSSSSPPLDHVMVSVQTTTDTFGGETLHKAEL